jgi:hypothetical protein
MAPGTINVTATSTRDALGRGLARRSGRIATPWSGVGRPRRYAALPPRTGYVRSGTGPELLPTFFHTGADPHG